MAQARSLESPFTPKVVAAAAAAAEDPRDEIIAQLSQRLAALETAAQGGAPFSEQNVSGGAAGDHVLFGYFPKLDPDRPLTSSYFMVPVPTTIAPLKEGDAPTVTITTHALIPGLQKIKREIALDILGSPAETIKVLISRGILKLWNEQSDIRHLDEITAQEAIRLTEAPTLLAEWASHWIALPKLVKERLTRREEELKLTRSSATRQIFGQTVNN